MNRESQVRFVAVLLFLMTVAAVIFAGFNFQKERESVAPDDGIGWIEGGGKLVADRVEPTGPGAKGGIKQGDELVSIRGEEVKNTPALERQLYRSGVWSKATYSLLRGGVPLDCDVILAPADRSLNNWLRAAGPTFDQSAAYEMLTFMGEDLREGVTALRAKRPPKFPSAQ